MNVEKCLAAVGASVLAALLLAYGHAEACIAVSSSLVAFFVGDSNGRNQKSKEVS